MMDRIAAFIDSENMFSPGARVGVAVSGGIDSRCLLDVLFEIRSIWNLSLTILHVNHCLRGAESDADEAFVRSLAAEYGLTIYAERADVSTADDNLEQAARDARRRFFRGFLDSGILDRVALAHTRSDQAETVLLRFLRGSYITGLCGMRPVTRDGFVRPFLCVDRDEVALYLGSRSLSYRNDSSNFDVRFARNRVRHDLLPQLTEEWNPRLPSLLAQYAELAREDEEYWERLVTEAVPPPQRGSLILTVADLVSAPPALARRVIRRAIQAIRGDLRQIDFRHVDVVLNLIRGPDGHARVQIPGLDVLRSLDQVRFAKPATEPVPRDFSVPVEPSAAVALPAAGVEFRFEIVDRAGIHAEIDDLHGKLEAELDWERIKSHPLELRNWRPGDSYRRVGRDHEQKIKLMFQEYRIPLWERRNWAVLCAGGKIVWAQRFGPAHGFAAEPHTAAILRIFERKTAPPMNLWQG
jgi:tRNA(Ile)-lysidine synthase